MSVYTAIDAADLEALLQQYPLGHLKAFRGIEAGIENTNYFVTTSTGEYVLTLFEQAGVEELQFDLQLMEHLATHEIPCPLPLHRTDGALLSQLQHKPVSLVSRLQGQSPQQITPRHCQQIGHWLARLHVAGHEFPLTRPNPRGLNWARLVLQELKQQIPSADYDLMLSELDFQTNIRREQLPQGIIHSDLFSDNVLFTGDKLSGLLDLYDASVDALLYDVAVTANAWCSRADGGFDDKRLHSLLAAYQEIRPLSEKECAFWPAMTRAAALRFWLSRLHHRMSHRPGELTQIKPPETFEQILRQRLCEPSLSGLTCG